MGKTSPCGAVSKILAENARRTSAINSTFNPVTGQGSVGRRTKVSIEGFPLPEQWLPSAMMSVPLVRQLAKAGSLDAFITGTLGTDATDENRQTVIDRFVRVRCRYDFPFWAAAFVYIKNKGGGEDVLFRLTNPQRRFVSLLESLRTAGKPIRIILLKARQWGGSTTSQIYMAWLQLVHKVGLNSLIVAHQGAGSDEIKDMFDRMIQEYPLELLYREDAERAENEPKLERVGQSGLNFRVPQRSCKIRIGTAERPDSCRGGDYSLVHLSEVGIWKATEGKKPEDIVRSACSGVLYKPYTMIVYESTANGTGNFFHREYLAAKRGQSQFRPMFVSWFDIEQYSLPFQSDAERKAFAERLYGGRGSGGTASAREECGKYLWWLWTLGATLEAIHWYIEERRKYGDHGQMAAEYPSDDIEAFVHSGHRVFDKYRVEALRSTCRPPRFKGEIAAAADEGRDALCSIRFSDDAQGRLWIWDKPEIDAEERVTDRYLAVVDIGGRSSGADWSVIVVFDRLFMAEGGKPSVVAQWYGHTDIDLLAWKAAQIAAYYDNALLVIESNTLETHERGRDVDGDQSAFILNRIRDVYPNLYARRRSEEDIREGRPVKYGFHTNISTKPMVISTLVKVIREKAYVERDTRCVDEYINYEKKPNGSFGAIPGEHDDLLMTRAIGLHVCFSEMPLPKTVSRKADAVIGKRRKAISAATI